MAAAAMAAVVAEPPLLPPLGGQKLGVVAHVAVGVRPRPPPPPPPASARLRRLAAPALFAAALGRRRLLRGRRAARRQPEVAVGAPVSDEVQRALRAGGLFGVDKPRGITSHKMVQKVLATVNDALGNAASKAGHGGTLDPEATGVLVMGVNRATRQLQGFLNGPKVYEAEVTMGIETDTQDAAGQVVAEASYEGVTREVLEDLVPSFTGTIKQVPPMYSALKIKGRRLYSLALDGQEVPRLPRDVVVHRLEILSFTPPTFTMRVECGRGLYVRTLGLDLMRAAGSLGHVSALRRTRAGGVGLEHCLTAEQVTDASTIVSQFSVMPLPPLPTVRQPKRQRPASSRRPRREAAKRA